MQRFDKKIMLTSLFSSAVLDQYKNNETLMFELEDEVQGHREFDEMWRF